MKQIKDSKLSSKDLEKIKDFLEKENTAPEGSSKELDTETKDTEWEDLKNEILSNLSNELDPKDKENWGTLIEEIKNILSANDSKLLKIVIYYKLG